MAQKPIPAKPAAKPKAQAGPDPVAAMMQAFLNAQQAGMGPLNWLGGAWVEAFGDVGTELAGFVAERIKEDVKTQHEMLHCKTPAELQQVQARFVQTAIDQYTAETGKLVELNQKLVDSLRQGGDKA